MPSQPTRRSAATISAGTSARAHAHRRPGRPCSHERADRVAQEDVVGRHVEVHGTSVARGAWMRAAPGGGAAGGRGDGGPAVSSARLQSRRAAELAVIRARLPPRVYRLTKSSRCAARCCHRAAGRLPRPRPMRRAEDVEQLRCRAGRLSRPTVRHASAAPPLVRHQTEAQDRAARLRRARRPACWPRPSWPVRRVLTRCSPLAAAGGDRTWTPSCRGGSRGRRVASCAHRGRGG